MCPDALTPAIPDRLIGDEAGAWVEDARLLTERRLAELRRLSRTGMGIARKMGGWLDGSVSAEALSMLIGGRPVVSEFIRVSRAVRQVIVLELELLGLRPAPDRDAVRAPAEAGEARARTG
jgi:hypothetical protein